jgi:3-hydroxyacyl-[acyl-carrier-protein] dehydratase
LRFQLIDRVLDQQPETLRAVKVLTSAEEYLADHFPSFPVMPGVLMLESLVQAARTLVAETEGPPEMPLVVSEVRNLRYGHMVRPGQSLEVEVSLRKREGGGWQFQGTGTVEQQMAVQGRFTLSPLPESG